MNPFSLAPWIPGGLILLAILVDGWIALGRRVK
jgi:hypothetical protein